MSSHYDGRGISLIRHWVTSRGQSQSATLGSMCVCKIHTPECCRLTSAARRFPVIHTNAVAGTPGVNLGNAQQILQLKNQLGHRPRKGEMLVCPALLKPRSATRTRPKIVHCLTLPPSSHFLISHSISLSIIFHCLHQMFLISHSLYFPVILTLTAFMLTSEGIMVKCSLAILVTEIYDSLTLRQNHRPKKI